ncbi:YitT family protein [Clostridium sediminicola]|uniref:YczE/YyaS/YitT family protein n=1 Tax=Clostridium sediminicola TaxID=3114879 RepID=UPI0031F1DA64
MKWAKKVFIYVLGFFILAVGINISKLAGLGISPVSSIPYACELIFGIELGKATYIIYIGLILLQIILLRKDYKIRNLLQIVSTFVLGTFITYTGNEYLLFWLPEPSTYILQLVYLLISIVVIGIGVSLYLCSNIMMLPAEGLCGAIVQVSKDKLNFGNAKVCVDSGMVIISAILSIIFLGKLTTVREGTILAAILVGKVVGFFLKNYRKKIIDWFDIDLFKKVEVEV